MRRAFNRMNRPVELIHKSGSLVIPARGSISLPDEFEDSLGQLDSLLSRGDVEVSQEADQDQEDR